uniref:Uncharacterized protein n=1 Tax=Timema genevievae TaxID=629358 RepID=A0A7R9K182_TIMGE|nr:unnamed protein product [Timema genevievae]
MAQESKINFMRKLYYIWKKEKKRVFLKKNQLMTSISSAHQFLPCFDDRLEIRDRRCGMSPKQRTLWELFKDFLGNRDIGQQHELFNHRNFPPNKTFRTHLPIVNPSSLENLGQRVERPQGLGKLVLLSGVIYFQLRFLIGHGLPGSDNALVELGIHNAFIKKETFFRYFFHIISIPVQAIFISIHYTRQNHPRYTQPVLSPNIPIFNNVAYNESVTLDHPLKRVAFVLNHLAVRVVRSRSMEPDNKNIKKPELELKSWHSDSTALNPTTPWKHCMHQPLPSRPYKAIVQSSEVITRFYLIQGFLISTTTKNVLLIHEKM